MPDVRIPRRLVHLSVLLLALAAFGAQQWAVRTHWHGPTVSTAALDAGQLSTGEAPAEGQGLPHPDCLWCHAAAHASAAAPPSHWVGLPAVVFHFHLRPSAGAMAEFLPPLSWAWHSRGPPAA